MVEESSVAHGLVRYLHILLCVDWLGGDAGAVNRQLVESLQREADHMQFILKQRYAQRDARFYAHQAQRQGVAA